MEDETKLDPEAILADARPLIQLFFNTIWSVAFNDSIFWGLPSWVSWVVVLWPRVCAEV